MSAPWNQPPLKSRRLGWSRNESGTLLIEVLVASAIATVVVVFVSATVSLFVMVRDNLNNDVRKHYLAEEGYELITFLKNEDWSNIGALTPGRHYALVISTSSVQMTADVPELVDRRYARTFVTRQLFRASSGAIVPQGTVGAVVDQNGRYLDVYIVDDKGTTTVSAVITNLFP